MSDRLGDLRRVIPSLPDDTLLGIVNEIERVVQQRHHPGDVCPKCRHSVAQSYSCGKFGGCMEDGVVCCGFCLAPVSRFKPKAKLHKFYAEECRCDHDCHKFLGSDWLPKEETG